MPAQRLAACMRIEGAVSQSSPGSRCSCHSLQVSALVNPNKPMSNSFPASRYSSCFPQAVEVHLGTPQLLILHREAAYFPPSLTFAVKFPVAVSDKREKFDKER